MFDKGEFLRWIESAKRTLRSAEGDLEREDYNWTCFKAQQVAEMAVKALHHGMGLPAYGHSVSRLLSDLGSREVSVSSDVMRSAKVLDSTMCRLGILMRGPKGRLMSITLEKMLRKR